MTRIFKITGNILLALLAVGIAFVVIFLLNPSWQKAMLENALERDGARKWQVGTVDFSPVSAELTGLFMLQGSAGAEVGRLRLDGPFWKSPLTNRIRVESGEIEGLFVDLSRVSVGSITSEDWQDFLGRASGDLEFWEERIGILLQKIAATGWDLHLTDLSVKGQILLPGNRSIPLRFGIVEADSKEPAQVRLRALEIEEERIL